LALVRVADENDIVQEPAAGRSRRGVVDELDRARAREYALLAMLLARGPDTQLIGRLALLQRDATPLGVAHAMLADASRRSSEASAAREYFDLFVGLSQDQILPYASHYLPARCTVARSLRETFQLLGIERVIQSEPEDHIATMYEIMAGLIDGAIAGRDDCDRDFFAKHLATWARRFFVDLERASSAGFYACVGLLGRTFIEIETEAYSFLA
jgi:TorA maturation chaperone TorD